MAWIFTQSIPIYIVKITSLFVNLHTMQLRFLKKITKDNAGSQPVIEIKIVSSDTVEIDFKR